MSRFIIRWFQIKKIKFKWLFHYNLTSILEIFFFIQEFIWIKKLKFIRENVIIFNFKMKIQNKISVIWNECYLKFLKCFTSKKQITITMVKNKKQN